MNNGLLPYRPCVGIMAFNCQGFVWVGRRADMPGNSDGGGHFWQMPQGGIDDGEDPAAAALRELYEETAMRSVQIVGRTRDWLHYDLPPELSGKIWGGRFRGQKQLWFAVRFTGTESEIDIGPREGHDAEFEAWKWVAPGDLVASIVPFKRDVYRSVVAELGPLVRVDCG